MVRVFGSPDEAQWFNLWEGAVAIFSMCVRRAHGGVVRNLGDFAFLRNGPTRLHASIRDSISAQGHFADEMDCHRGTWTSLHDTDITDKLSWEGKCD